MIANKLQFAVITRFARRHRISTQLAARVWIPRKSRAFRAWFNSLGTSHAISHRKTSAEIPI
jgi:hypothetical protein